MHKYTISGIFRKHFEIFTPANAQFKRSAPIPLGQPWGQKDVCNKDVCNIKSLGVGKKVIKLLIRAGKVKNM